MLKRGTMVDASVIDSSNRPPTPGGAAVDADAALTARKGQRGTRYGYKAHIGVDLGSRLIRRCELTPANVNETVVADRLVCGGEGAVWADKAYAKRDRRARLKRLGIKDRLMHKSWGGGPPLRASERRHNALIAPVRAAVEAVLATLQRWLGLARVRYRGRAKNAAHLALVATADSMRRALRLAG